MTFLTCQIPFATIHYEGQIQVFSFYVRKRNILKKVLVLEDVKYKIYCLHGEAKKSDFLSIFNTKVTHVSLTGN